MMETQGYWEDSSAHSMQVKYESLDGRSCKDEMYRMSIGAGYCEGNLNFATASEDDEIYTKKKVSRQDPMSHRIIEKRRRDRMNNCLADLSRLIPSEYLKKGRGRVEKTEIIEMAIRHMKHLQGLRQDSKQQQQHSVPLSAVHQMHAEDSVDSVGQPSLASSSAAEHYRLGYQECLSEAMHFLVEVEGYFARDALCVQLVGHLQQHCDKILASSDRLGFPHPVDLPTTNGTSSVSSFAHVNGGLPPSVCPTTNGLGLLGNSNNNNNNNNNNNSHSLNNNHNNNNNINNNNNNGSSSINSTSNGSSVLQHNGGSISSDRCSSSGVSSFDSSECRSSGRSNSLVPPPTLTSDDSNHSSHSLSQHQSSGSCSSGGGGGGGNRPPTNYKFKNSIKQRFSADQRVKSSCGSPPPPSCTGSSSSSSDLSPQACGKQHHQHQQGVPIFALHDNGGFYVPLTLEASLLRPQLGCPAGELSPDAVLHPVTISVNFNHVPSPPWNNPPSPGPHHLQ